MPSYVALQPNGKLAVFSSIVDDFTVLDATEEQLIDYFLDHMGRKDAREKVQRGLNDEAIEPGEKMHPPLHRWKESLDTMRVVHGRKRLEEFLAERKATEQSEAQGASTARSRDEPQ